jgi:hypothetical protein
LALDPVHVVVIHCLAGHGRTGVVICCVLFYEGLVPDSKAAFELFAQKRSRVAKAVGHPSQIRYVQYAEQHLLSIAGRPSHRYIFGPAREKVLGLVHITNLLPNQGADRFQMIVFNDQFDPIFNSSWFECPDVVPGISLKYTPNVVLAGDFTVKVYVGQKGMTKPIPKELMRCSLNTDFVPPGGIVLPKAEVDGPHSDKTHVKFDARMAMLILLTPAPSATSP